MGGRTRRPRRVPVVHARGARAWQWVVLGLDRVPLTQGSSAETPVSGSSGPCGVCPEAPSRPSGSDPRAAEGRPSWSSPESVRAPGGRGRCPGPHGGCAGFSIAHALWSRPSPGPPGVPLPPHPSLLRILPGCSGPAPLPLQPHGEMRRRPSLPTRRSRCRILSPVGLGIALRPSQRSQGSCVASCTPWSWCTRLPSAKLLTLWAPVSSFVKVTWTWDFPGGAVVKNPPASAGDTGPSPGLGRSHTPQSD